MSTLFSPLKIRNLEVKNRIVMPPMVCFGLGDDSGLVTDQHVAHYEARARGGVGLVIVEATCVSRTGRLSPDQLGLWSDEQVAGFGRLAEACHRHGAKILVQIHHGGLNSHPDVVSEFVAPSNYHGKVRDRVVSARALTVPEIHGIQREFVAAALRAKEAGLDGVELHGAHGFIISQFFSTLVNERVDSYGGSVSNRVRLAAEIIKGIRREAGNNFILSCRMGCNEPDLETSIKIAGELERSGIDLLHVSSGFAMDKGLAVPEGFDYRWICYGGTQIKTHVGVPVIVVNGLRTPEKAAYLLEHDLADLTAIGMGLLVDPQWANKAQRNEPVVACINCKTCKLLGPEKSCVQWKRTKQSLARR